MSDAKHTPGEWRPGRPDMFNVQEGDRSPKLGKSVYVDDSRGGFHHVTGARLPLTVAEAFGDTREEVMANARLIAAAPALFAALRAEQEWRDVEREDRPGDADGWQLWEQWQRRIHQCILEADRLRAAALAKAEGREESDGK